MPPDSRRSLALVGLEPLMAKTAGHADVRIALLDGPVHADHPELARDRLLLLSPWAACAARGSGAGCAHGTFVLGILAARRDSAAPAICPGCTVLVRPIFTAGDSGAPLSARPADVAAAVAECVDLGARVLNLSAAFWAPSMSQDAGLQRSLDHAARRGVLVVAAAGNRGMLTSSPILRHPSVIAAVAYGLDGRPLPITNVSPSMGRRGLGAPGEGVSSLATGGVVRTATGSSIAAAFITGAIALLWSLFPGAGAAEIRGALLQSAAGRRRSVVPPLFDAGKAWSSLSSAQVSEKEEAWPRLSQHRGPLSAPHTPFAFRAS
jgi:subtilisin family serine protease